MTGKPAGQDRLVAVTNVAFDGAVHPPGAVFEAPEEIARELIEAGAARPFDDSDDGATLEDVKGIGPKTAGKLKAAGLEDLLDLADLDDTDLFGLAKMLDESTDSITDWRNQARKMRPA